ncbi:MAG: gamma carbonic anhydrase family protein [Deltaproteobacteria bacterium]|nr:gamma carbonic anhydrase family protein [Deltaproteobacteria bacterium]
MVHPFRGKHPKLHDSVFQAPGCQIVGDVELGSDVSIWFNVVVRGDVHWIKIGDGTNIQDGSILHVSFNKAPLTIGKNVTVGHLVMLHGCTIGDFVLVGMRSVIMDHAEIGGESIVAAGALVTEGFKAPPRSLILGSPAKVVRSLGDDEIKFLHKSAENYKQYVRWYREEANHA